MPHGLAFADRDGNALLDPINDFNADDDDEDDDDDSTYVPDNDDYHDDDDDDCDDDATDDGPARWQECIKELVLTMKISTLMTQTMMLILPRMMTAMLTDGEGALTTTMRTLTMKQMILTMIMVSRLMMISMTEVPSDMKSLIMVMILTDNQVMKRMNDDGPPPPPPVHAMDLRYGARTQAHNLRPRRPRCDYSHLHATLEHIVMTPDEHEART